MSAGLLVIVPLPCPIISWICCFLSNYFFRRNSPYNKLSTYSILFILLEGRRINKLEGVYESWWKKVRLGSVNLSFSSGFNACYWFFFSLFWKFVGITTTRSLRNQSGYFPRNSRFPPLKTIYFIFLKYSRLFCSTCFCTHVSFLYLCFASSLPVSKLERQWSTEHFLSHYWLPVLNPLQILWLKQCLVQIIHLYLLKANNQVLFQLRQLLLCPQVICNLR